MRELLSLRGEGGHGTRRQEGKSGTKPDAALRRGGFGLVHFRKAEQHMLVGMVSLYSVERTSMGVSGRIAARNDGRLKSWRMATNHFGLPQGTIRPFCR